LSVQSRLTEFESGQARYRGKGSDCQPCLDRSSGVGILQRKVSSAVVQNLIYALNQVVHNFGAAAVIGFAGYGLLRRAQQGPALRSVYLGLVIAWAVQGATGVGFGITSLAFYGKLPDIHGVAVAAVSVKMVCVALGLVIAFIGFRKHAVVQTLSSFFPIASLVLAATSLSAAAFLRWFS